MDFTADEQCFACGRKNPGGLKLTFHDDNGACITHFTPDAVYQGYQGILHGGIMATLLDEVMARYVWKKVGPAATARIEIRYRQPAPVGRRITVRGWITAERRGGRAFEMAAEARNAEGVLLAEATGLVMRLPDKGA
jgi:acyl-coenzyme A thioesterase PaaI-like protein